jgi:glycosyltransferase involved in cell wall biosynthesis
VVWNIRETMYDLRREKKLTALMVRLGALLSRRADAIIYNSHLAASQHAALGYDDRNAIVIPNGFDTVRFAPRPEARAIVRQQLGLPATALLVGRFGRNHPMKNFPSFLRAAAMVRAAQPRAHFVIGGPGVTSTDPTLRAMVQDLSLSGSVHFLGEVSDMPTILSAMDLVCSSSSWGEGFPNVIGESMACGVPCVTTDVGDSARVLGGAGAVVPPNDDGNLGRALAELLETTAEHRRTLGEYGRSRITQEYSLGKIAGQYDELYSRLLETKRQ